jgi:hypothetical protein
MKFPRGSLAAGVYMLLAGAGVSAGEERLQLRDGPGRDLTASACASCHSLDYILMNAPVMNRSAWEKTLHKMVDKFGAPLRPQDVDEILAYLSTHYSG